MRWLTLVPMFALLAPTDAAASGCYLGPFAPSEVPEGCPVVVYHHAQQSPYAPVALATRDGTTIDITGTVDKSSTTLGVGHPEYDCNGDITTITPYDTPYDVYRVSLANVIVGEQIALGGALVRITPAAPCVEPAAPEPLCEYIPDRCDGEPGPGDDEGGCSALGGARGGIGFVLLALLLAMRARR